MHDRNIQLIPCALRFRGPHLSPLPQGEADAAAPGEGKTITSVGDHQRPTVKKIWHICHRFQVYKTVSAQGAFSYQLAAVDSVYHSFLLTIAQRFNGGSRSQTKKPSPVRDGTHPEARLLNTAPHVPVLTVSPFSKLRAGRASSGLPSING